MPRAAVMLQIDHQQLHMLLLLIFVMYIMCTSWELSSLLTPTVSHGVDSWQVPDSWQAHAALQCCGSS